MTDQNKESDLTEARRVMRTEADALMQFAENLDDSFHDAVEAILNAKGRVIVSGMGKSGHVGAKIVATLASTGTPASFVHPAEASHGDLGMVTPSDVVIVLSNSGETPELSDVIAHSKRNMIPMIGVASKPNSTLLQAADIKIVLPNAPEACPMGLAPTTSTTATLAFGDALAVALMKRRDFKPENFRAFHPGGKLGAKLLTVQNLMHPKEELPLVKENTPMGEAILEMSGKGFGVIGVVDDAEKFTGIVTDGDLRRNMVDLMSKSAAEVATRDPKSIRPDALAEEALAIMNAYKITSIFVVDPANSPIGILHIHDCLRAGVA